MAKRLQEYVKYTIKELDQYAATPGSCVMKINTDLHLSMGPFCLVDFKHVLMAHLVRSKVGFYDIQLRGIVLDVKNVKILGTVGAMRADDPRIHVNVNADVYVFKPEEGAVLTGEVKHIGSLHVGVVLYRVFNANLRVCRRVDKDAIEMDQEVKFRIQNYNLQNIFPYIDGELLTATGDAVASKGKKTTFNGNDNSDSGIEERGGIQPLDDLLSAIKREDSDDEEGVTVTKKKRSHKNASSSESESDTVTKKNMPHKNTYSSESESDTVTKKKRSHKRSASDSSESEAATVPLTPTKIKKETIKSEDEDSTPKKVKKEKMTSKNTSFDEVDVKQEFSDEDD